MSDSAPYSRLRADLSWVFDDAPAPASPQLSGFVDAQEAIRLDAARRRVRVVAALLLGMWTIAAVAFTQQPSLEGAPGLFLWLAGCAAVILIGHRAMQAKARDLHAMVVVDGQGQVVGAADRVAASWVEQRAAPGLAGFAVYHVIGVIARLLFPGDAVPVPIGILALGAGIATYVAVRRQLAPAAGD